MSKKRERERGLSRYLRERYSPNWSEAYEPGIGSGTGYPDTQFLCPRSKKLLPIELKRCEIKNDIVFPHDFQPTQPIWHRSLWLAGGKSAIIMGIPGQRSGWDCFAVPGHMALKWREGYAIGDCYQLHNPDRAELERLVAHFLQ